VDARSSNRRLEWLYAGAHMKTADRAGDGAEPVGDPRDEVRRTVDDAQRASAADQVAADADQSSADADQTLSNADQSASNADRRSTGIDQLASDRDQAAADRQHTAGVDLTPADEKAYKASHDEREAVSIARQRNRVKRARTARHRDATADKRDRTTETRGEGGRARDARVAVGQRAIDAWETSRRAEDELSRESGAKYRGLLEAAPDAMVVVDGAGEIVLLNVQAEKQFGYHRHELIGQQVANIIPEGFAERLIADDLRSAADALAQQIGSGIELIGRRKDGSEFPIEIMLSPLESAEGILVTAAIRDISVRKEAERHLAQMESRYRGLLEAAPDAMVVVNQSGEIVLLNLQTERQFGYRREELVGQPVELLVPRRSHGRHAAYRDLYGEAPRVRAMGSGIELSGRRKDGTEFPIEIMLSPLESAEGILVTAMIRDISVRKAAERHLAQMEGRYRGLLEAAPDAMVVVNQAGEIVLLNVQAEKQFGYHRDELVGQPVTNIIPEGFAERLIADDLRSAEDALAQQIGSGIELTGRRKDGSEFPIEIMLSPLESAEGILVTAAIRNISVRKAAEEHLAQMEARYRGLLEAAPDAMVVVDQRGEIVLLNLQAEKQFGYHRDELVGQPVTNIIPEGFAERLVADDLRSAADALAQVIGTGIELVALRKDGTEFPIEIMLSPLESAEGILVTAAIRNISVRKLAESQLLQAQKLESIGRLAGGIAHDFNNMLFVINGHAELLDQDLIPTRRPELDLDETQRNVRAIREAGERAATLTAQLLAFSRQQVISPSVLDLNAAIDGLEPMVRQLIGENMRLVLKLDDDAGHIRADAGQLDQILVNFVVNARDAMPDGGTVTIETGNVSVDESYAVEHFDVRPGLYVLLVVSDTGVGMDRATREHIFEPFFTTKKPGKGTGLGLATAYGIVHQAGGHIWLYSEPGVGSTFKLYFPRVDAPGTKKRPNAAATAAVGAGTVLVVEDEPVVRDMTTQMLTRSGYEVIAVASGAEATTRLAGPENSIDVLITDVIMPNMSGIELAEWTMDRYPHVGVVLLSGYTAETLDLERVTTRGATFVPKPVTSGQLLVAVQQAQALRQANPTERTSHL
jgi:PAS domain S-box-containing protein